MKNKSLVRISNVIGIVSILLLVYWVFIFISIEVFGFKVFRENITESFYMSVMGILALMFGALIINIMFNLTRIAEKHNLDSEVPSKNVKAKTILLIASFPLIFLLLYIGDFLSSRKKEQLLVDSAKSIINKNVSYTNTLVNYNFEEKYVVAVADILDVLTETDENFPTVSVLVKDELDGNDVYLGFSRFYAGKLNDTISLPKKKEFIEATTKPDREYLESVFKKGNPEYRYTSSDGNYELFYPVKKNNKTIVLYFSDQQRYGKIGS